jgi:serine/threonine protein kinase
MSKRVWPPASATYKISGWLGSGTFGAVFKARRRSTHDNPSQSSSVAVKVIPRYSFASSRELEVMQILREKPHVAVMQLIECFSVASTEASAARILTCLVLPLYDSCLRTYLDAPEHAAKHSDAVTRILRLQHIGGQLSSALAHLHALRIIHRDLSA